MQGNYSNDGKTNRGTKRIFIAIKVDPGDILAKAIDSLKFAFTGNAVRWTDKDNIHITLSFLGDTDTKKIPGIISMLEKVCSASCCFELTLRSTGLFRDINDPRILWIGIDSSENLKKLNRLITTGLEEAGFPIDNRSFSPHITIGRVKRNAATNKEIFSSFLDNYHNTIFRTMNVSEIILYESVLLPTGPLYKPIRIISLS